MLRQIGRWVAEVAGIGLVAVAAGMVYPPLGLAVIGVYALVLANMEGEE